MTAPAVTDTTDAVRAMLEPRRVAVVGASARHGSFGERLISEVGRSPAPLEVHLENPRYDLIGDQPCVPSLEAIEGPVDLVLLGVPDAAVEEQLALAARRGDRAAVVYGGLFDVDHPGHSARRDRVAAIARAGGSDWMCG